MAPLGIKLLPVWILVLCSALSSWESSVDAFLHLPQVHDFQTHSFPAIKKLSSCGNLPTRKLGLRMKAAEDFSDEVPRLLGSRRFARAVSELQKDPTANDVNRFLWSRRLFNAIQGLQTLSDASSDYQLPESSNKKVQQVSSSVGNTVSLGAIASARDASSLSDSGSDAGRPQLPELSGEDLALLARGERVQRQMRHGRVGTGMVVLDVEADLPLVFAVLTDIDRYPERIATVREAITYQTGERLRKTQFQISKFRLRINTELRCRQEQSMLEFTVDPERPAPFLEDATGFWYLEDVSEGGETRTRVWLVAGIACSRLLPTAIVDYAASKALPRATTWVKPVMEELHQELKQSEVSAEGVEEFVREHARS